MSEYKGRLETAKKAYIATDGPGEAGQRFVWTVAQVFHSYTNMDVENLRYLFPKLDEKTVDLPKIGEKDLAYVIGHITQFFVLPTIIFEVAAQIKAKKD